MLRGTICICSVMLEKIAQSSRIKASPSLPTSVSPVSASSGWNLNFIQNCNCKWIGKLDVFCFVFIFLRSVVEESTLREWGNGVWGLINHIPQTGFFCFFLIFKLLLFYLHCSLFTHLSFGHYLITTIVLIFWGTFMPLVLAASSVWKLGWMAPPGNIRLQLWSRWTWVL